MAPNRASSPSAMLYAHQLKREHGFLLDRMQKMESAISKIDSTARASRNAPADHDIAAIAQQVQGLTQGASSKATEKLRKEVIERMEKVEAEVEAITAKVDRLDDKSGKMEEERKMAFKNEKALVKRVKDVEEQLNVYEKRLNERGDEIDQGQMDIIRDQLASVIEQTKAEGTEHDSFKQSLQALKEVVDELKKDNARIAKEMKALGKRPVAPTAPAQHVLDPAPEFGMTMAPSKALPASKINTIAAEKPLPALEKGKSTARARGEACSACRRSHRQCTHGLAAGSGEEEDILATTAPKQCGSKAKAPQIAMKTASSHAMEANSKAARPDKAIEKEIVEAQQTKPVKAPAARGLQREIQQLEASSQFIKQVPTTQHDSEKPVLKSGRGFIVVERTSSADQNTPRPSSSQDSSAGVTAAERIKRGRGRPRKILQPETQPQPATAPKRGRGRPRKDGSPPQAAVDPPPRGRGRPKKSDAQDAEPQPAAEPATKAPARQLRQIKQEEHESRAQPMREVKAAPTMETPPPAKKRIKAVPIKQEPGVAKKRSALAALQAKSKQDQPDADASQLSSAPPSPPPMTQAPQAKTQDKGKRKAVEEPPQQQQPPRRKRRTIEQADDGL